MFREKVNLGSIHTKHIYNICGILRLGKDLENF